MKTLPTTQRVQKTLMRWFAKNRRDLPWRLPAGRHGRTTDPYLIAVSEVMLQQTQVDRVIPKFLAWRRAWPTTKSLAAAPLHEVLKLWSGLGYNLRALRLRDAARTVMKNFGGQWPRGVAELESLPGFGPYTARAVASFAYNMNVAAVDTNIRRVVSRIYFGMRKVSASRLEHQATTLVPKNNSAAWHAALMDFGSAICTSRNPQCEICPMKNFCLAYPAVLQQKPKRKSSSAKFQETDRYWRGAITRLFLQRRLWTTSALIRSLQSTGSVDKPRVVRLLNALAQEGLLARHGATYSISR